MDRCVQVIVTPEERSITVFNNGRPHGSRGSIPIGGQTQPILIAGLKLQWKNPQKKEKK